MKMLVLTLLIAAFVWPTHAQSQPLVQSKVWMIPLQNDGISEDGPMARLLVTNPGPREARVTVRFYSREGQPERRQIRVNNAGDRRILAEEVVNYPIAPYMSNQFTYSGSNAVFEAVLSTEPVIVSARAARIMEAGNGQFIATPTLAFDCDGADQQAFLCSEPLTATQPPLPPLTGPTQPPPPPTPGELRNQNRPPRGELPRSPGR